MPLRSLHIQGFKSINDQSLEFSPLNVFIGGNGAGKSNLISVFHFLNRITRQELAISQVNLVAQTQSYISAGDIRKIYTFK